MRNVNVGDTFVCKKPFNYLGTFFDTNKVYEIEHISEESQIVYLKDCYFNFVLYEDDDEPNLFKYFEYENIHRKNKLKTILK